MPSRFSALVLAVVACCAPLPTRAEPEPARGYELGRGYKLGDTGIRLGGYASVEAAAPRASPWEFSVSDLSLFTTWEYERWRFFSETEWGDLLTAGQDQGLSTKNAHFELERLYLDYLFSDALSVRFGKFLTPIGRWNLLHASPLVWTTTRPVATYQLFSRNATGLMAYGSVPVGQRSLDYSAYASASDSLDPYRSENPFEDAYGGRVLYSAADNLEVGLSYANYQLNASAEYRYNLVGAEGFWSWRKFEVNSEWVFRAGGPKNLWQGFVQGVAPLVSHWYAVGRYEYFEQAQGAAGQLGVFGLAFRPLPPLVWKVEYRIGAHNEQAAPDGLYGSIAVLF
jgi:hypothetical protein